MLTIAFGGDERYTRFGIGSFVKFVTQSLMTPAGKDATVHIVTAINATFDGESISVTYDLRSVEPSNYGAPNSSAFKAKEIELLPHDVPKTPAETPAETIPGTIAADEL